VRGHLWHNGTEDWPIRWEDGDTIGCAADLELGQLWFGRNGVWSLAFEGCSSKWEAGLYPAIAGTSMSFTISSATFCGADGRVQEHWPAPAAAV